MFASSSTKEIVRAREMIERVAAGDFEARLTEIKATGELRELLLAVNDLVDRCDAYIRESAACMDHVSRNEYFRKIMTTSMQGAFLRAAETVNGALTSIQHRVDEFGGVADGFEETVQGVVDNVSGAADAMSNASRSMTAIADDTSAKADAVADAAKQAADNVAMVAAASEELAASIQEISTRIGGATAVANGAADVAATLSGQVDDLHRATDQIATVVSLIREIAEQTNLLALNATIEASRAGDAGRGFAVVAGEVKNLAQQTAKATEEIGGFVTNIQRATETTLAGVSDLSLKVGEISEANTAVSAAVEEQSAATSEIARNIELASAGTRDVTGSVEDLRRSAQETRRSSSEVDDAAARLSHEAMALRSTVDGFLTSARAVA